MTETVYVSNDTFVYENEPDTNFDDEYFLYTSTYTNNLRYILVDWDLSSVDLEDAVDIELYVDLLSGTATGSIDMFRVTSSWTSSTVTWNTMPTHNTFSADYVMDSASGSSAGWKSWDICGLVGADYDGDITDYGAYFVDIDTSDLIRTFASTDAGGVVKPYVLITNHSDYDYYWTTYTGVIYNGVTKYLTGTSRILQGEIEQVGDYTSYMAVRVPWETDYESGEYIDVDETLQYSRSITGGTEYFEVTYDSTAYSAEVGYYPIYYVRWYRDYVRRYVKTTGDDDDAGVSWDTAWATTDKGMADTPADGELHIGFGSYNSTSNKLSPDNDDVEVIFETEDSGSGTGTTTINLS